MGDILGKKSKKGGMLSMVLTLVLVVAFGALAIWGILQLVKPKTQPQPQIIIQEGGSKGGKNGTLEILVGNADKIGDLIGSIFGKKKNQTAETPATVQGIVSLQKVA